MSEPTILCVLGMHRSGTSLLAQLLHALGLDLGPDEHLMRPSPANPQGHWENEPIKELNDEILERLGGTWSRPPELPAGWERDAALDDLRHRARDLVAEEFGGSERWAFKDPRTCLTLPFWQRILPSMRYLICLRNPVDVAYSLGRRAEEPLEFEHGAELWLTHVRAALAATAAHTQHMVFYEDLMADPEPVVRQLADFVGGQSEDAEAYTRAAIRIAVNDGLWHHRTTVSNVVAERRLPFHVKAMYLALRLFSPSPQGVGVESLDLLGAHAAADGRHRADLEQWLLERHADVERLVSERAQEQRLRQDAERQVRAIRAEVRQLQITTRKLEAAARAAADAQKALPAGSRDRAHEQLLEDIRARANELIPPGSNVLVAAKGDDELLRFAGLRGSHFPVGQDGRYLGYHPAGDTAVIAQLEALRASGADHLLVPAPTLWWLDHYQGLRRHLEDCYVPLLRDERCAIYRLSSSNREHEHGPLALLRQAVVALRTRSDGGDPSILDWRTRLGIAGQLPELAVFSSPGDEDTLPYLDRSVDVIVLVSDDPARVAEARRVAKGAVITVDPAFPDAAKIEWLVGKAVGWGDSVNLVLIPDPAEPAWEATLDAFADRLDSGFTGAVTVVGVAETLERARQAAASARLQSQLVEVDAAATLPQRGRAAAEVGDHPIQVFVTGPAVPLPGWLPAILGVFSRTRDAGVVGARIVSRLGVLEEAGGVLAADGSPRRRGEGDHDPDRPEYCFVRRVDFCSPPLLATSRDLFERLQGFRNGQVPSRDALVDFSLRAGRAGGAVYYQPHARIVQIGEPGR